MTPLPHFSSVTMTYKFVLRLQWVIRCLLLPSNGMDWNQDDDLHGITLSDGTRIAYGEQYHQAWFAGIVKDKVPHKRMQ